MTFNFSHKNKILWVAHLCPCVKGDHIELFQFLSELRHSNCSSGFPTVELLFQKYFIIWVQVFPIVRFPLQRDVCREFVLLSVNMSFPLCVGLSDNSLAYENYFGKCWQFLINSDNSSPQFQLSVWCTPALHSQWTILLNEEINILSILIYFDVHHCPHKISSILSWGCHDRRKHCFFLPACHEDNDGGQGCIGLLP